MPLNQWLHIAYKIAHKFFIEDIHTNIDEKDKNFNTKQNLDITEIKREIIDKLSPNHLCGAKENKIKSKYTKVFIDNIAEYFSNQEI